jgi:hypothetical protein
MGVDCSYVERIPEAKEKATNVLELQATPSNNPNYFFDDYQQAGDEYHIPNPHPDLHLRAWLEVADVLDQYGLEVWNGSPNSHLKAFPFRAFDEFEGGLLRSLSRFWKSIPSLSRRAG